LLTLIVLLDRQMYSRGTCTPGWEPLDLRNYRIYSLISRTFLPGICPVFCLRLIRAKYPEGQSFRILVRDDTHDTDEEDEDDTYDDLPYL